MQYFDVSLYPEEPDLSWICRNYTVMCDEYPGVYEFLQRVKNLRYCDCSENPQDWFHFKNGIIQSHWVIFVNCLPKDMDLLRYIANRGKYELSIIDESDESADELLPF